MEVQPLGECYHASVHDLSASRSDLAVTLDVPLALCKSCGRLR